MSPAGTTSLSTTFVAAPPPGFESLILSVTSSPFITFEGAKTSRFSIGLVAIADRSLAKVNRRHAADLAFGHRHQLQLGRLLLAGLERARSAHGWPCGPRLACGSASISCVPCGTVSWTSTPWRDHRARIGGTLIVNLAGLPIWISGEPTFHRQHRGLRAAQFASPGRPVPTSPSPLASAISSAGRGCRRFFGRSGFDRHFAARGLSRGWPIFWTD